jgi:hypothetical protein
MTLLQKIQNLIWFNNVAKIKEILVELNTKIEESSGGGSQDLQSVIDNGGQYNSEDGTMSVTLDNQIYFRKNSIAIEPISDSSMQLSKVGISENSIELYGYSNYIEDNLLISSRVHITNGEIFITKDVSLIDDTSTKKTFQLSIRNNPEWAQGNFYFYIPAKTSAGTYNLSTSVDGVEADITGNVNLSSSSLRRQNNTTTTALSAATLNSTYPAATLGFRVYCLQIVAGALIYEKTATGWIQNTTAIVT